MLSGLLTQGKVTFTSVGSYQGHRGICHAVSSPSLLCGYCDLVIINPYRVSSLQRGQEPTPTPQLPLQTEPSIWLECLFLRKGKGKKKTHKLSSILLLNLPPGVFSLPHYQHWERFSVLMPDSLTSHLFQWNLLESVFYPQHSFSVHQ